MSKLIRIAVSLILLTWIAVRIDWKDVSGAFAHLQVEYWLAAVGLLVVSQIVSAIRWRIFTRQLQFDASWKALTSFYFIGMYFNLLLPTSVGGDVVRAWYLDRKGDRKLAAFASVLLDRVNGLAVLIALAAVAVLCSPVPLDDWIPLSVTAIVLAGIGGFAGLLWIARYGKLSPQRTEQLNAMIALFRSPASLVTASLLSLFVQVANVVIAWLVSLGLGLDVSLGYYAILAPMVSMLTLLPISVNGTGVREWGTKLFLTPLGVSEGAAFALSILWFAVYLAGSALGGLVYLFGHFPKPEAQAGSPGDEVEHGSVDRHSDQGRARELRKAA